MGRKARGTVTYVTSSSATAGHYKVRITCPNGSRPWIHLDPSPRSSQREAWAREKAAAYSERARKHYVVGTKRRSKSSLSEGTELTAEEWWEALFDMRRARGDSAMETDRYRYKKHIKPVVDKHLQYITRDDCERLRDSLDSKIQSHALAWKSAKNVWAVWTTACRLACSSKKRVLRVRGDNPCSGVEAPDKGIQRSKTWLWPEEFLQLVTCEDVPLLWRRIYTLAIYLYLRGSELAALEWGDVDLHHGIVHIHRSFDAKGKAKSTKSGDARRFSIEAELLPLLRVMQRESGGEGPLLCMPSREYWAKQLRAHLKLAGVTRTELFTDDATRKHLTFHDLKATAITWMAIRGDEPLKIMQRAAHRNFKTTQIYLRTAEMVGATIGTPFPALPGSILDDDATGDEDKGSDYRPKYRPDGANLLNFGKVLLGRKPCLARVF